MKLTVDNMAVEVPDGATVLSAAEKAGLHVPTMCFRPGYEHFTSCMICMVLDRRSGKLIPACSAPAEDGMEIVTDSDEIRATRRQTLELLLSDHVGDCEAPCRRACHGHINIPVMIRHIAKKDFERAAKIVAESIPPGASGECAVRAEKACRRGLHDAPVAIGHLIAFLVREYPGLFKREGQPAGTHKRHFNCSMGRLNHEELAVFLEAADPAPRTLPSAGPEAGFTAAEAIRESMRCLHCDCRKAETCKLRALSDTYSARQRHYGTGPRKQFRQIRQHADVIYEPEKCIKCGLCVRITRNRKEALGLTFIGRGFDVRIGVPLDGSIAAALTATARECVEACPTAALAFG